MNLREKLLRALASGERKNGRELKREAEASSYGATYDELNEMARESLVRVFAGTNDDGLRVIDYEITDRGRYEANRK